MDLNKKPGHTLQPSIGRFYGNPNIDYSHFILIASSRSGHNYIKNNILSWLGLSWNDTRTELDVNGVMYDNWENGSPNCIEGKLNRLDINLSKDKLLCVLLIRDYLNWLASYAIMVHETFLDHPEWNESDHPEENEVIKVIIGNWEDIVKEYYGVTNYIPNVVKVNYDQFFVDVDYRKNICKQIGAEFNDDRLNIITTQGGGSSFDRLDYQSKAQSMNPFNRYEEILETEYRDHYLNLLKSNPSALDLYEKYFDIDDKKKKFIKDYVR